MLIPIFVIYQQELETTPSTPSIPLIDRTYLRVQFAACCTKF